MEQDRIELHAKFFNHERILVRDMDLGALRLHRQELEMIALEAKARLAAIDTESRERQANLTLKEKSWLVSNDYEPSVSDALANVKDRQKRMSKADKLREQMKSLGVEGVDELIANVEKKATSRNLDSISFNKPKISTVTELEATPSDTSQEKKEETPKDTEPFDVDSLFS